MNYKIRRVSEKNTLFLFITFESFAVKNKSFKHKGPEGLPKGHKGKNPGGLTFDTAPDYLTAIVSISIRAPIGRALTAKAARAGFWSV